MSPPAAEAKYKVNNITWMSCKEFTPVKGLRQIEDYMLVSLKADVSLPLLQLIFHRLRLTLDKSKCMEKQNHCIVCGVLFLQTWELHESWLHFTSYLYEEELKYTKRYHYRVRWSIPTCRKPIPQATANIYFVIEISKIKPAVSILTFAILPPLSRIALYIMKHSSCHN